MIGPLRSQEGGFGLVELLIALTVLNIAILAIFATFNAGTLSIRRAAQTSTGETLAEMQIERYRALPYDSVGLDATLLAGLDATHTGDADAWSGGAQVTASSCTTSAAECMPVQPSVAGPDNRSYRIDSYVTAPSPPAGGRAVKQVTVAVRSVTTDKLLARITSTFDKSTGCGTTAYPC